MGRTWYCILNGCEIGPLSSGGLGQLAANGQLEPDDLIRNATEQQWHPARHLKGLEFRPAVQRPEEPATGWFFRDGAVAFGPYSANELVALGALGLVRPTDYIRRGSNGDWIRADRIKGLRLRPDHPSAHPDPDVHLEKPGAVPPEAPADSLPPVDHTSTPPDDSSPSAEDISPPADDASAIGHAWSARAVPERWARLAKSVGQRLSQPQLNDALLALFVILPCILPAFGPPVGGLAGTVVAIGACALGLSLFYKRWQPIVPDVGWGAASAVFIAVFGAATLLQFTDFSMALAEGTISWNYGPLWLIKGVGSAYHAATESAYSTNHASFVELLAPTILSVGIFEEALKLLPAFVAYFTRQVTRRTGLLFIGAASGLAFGIAEGVWMLSNHTEPPTISNVIVRLVGGAACHAVMTSLAVCLFLWLRQRISLRPLAAWELMVGVAASLAMASVHGLYDTLLVVNMRQMAGFVMSGLVIALILIDRGLLVDRTIDPSTI